ncbi:MAG: Do family serine endopeptidase [Chlamydiota bacterium]
MIRKSYLLALIPLLALTPFVAKATDSVSLLKETSKGFNAVAKKAIPAVVFIESEIASKPSVENPLELFQEDFFNRFFGGPPGGPQNQGPAPKSRKPQYVHGTGFFVTGDGYILTNNHVVADAQKITVSLNGGKKLVAKVIGNDPRTDLAVIKIEGNQYPYLMMGDSDVLDVGEWVIAVGNPFGLDASVTVGVVSAKGRSQLHITDFEDFIQTDAAINPGNSGGPLLNVDGEVVGVNTAIVSNNGGYMGIGFAVPSNMALRVMEQLIKSGSVNRGYVGVVLQPLDEDLANSFGLNKSSGALAAEVTKGSPADIAGLRQGDIILSYNNIPVENISTLRNAISLMDPGSDVKLMIFREGKTLPLTVKVGSYVESQGHNEELYNKFGFEVDEVTSEAAKKAGVQELKGVVVTKVAINSLADRAGIKPGTIIIAVDRVPVVNKEEFDKGIKKSLESQKVLLLVKQGSMTRFITLKF